MTSLRTFGLRSLSIVVLLSTLLGAAAAASAADHPLHGVALVIGQSNYETLQTLSNPSDDAGDIGKLLFDLGFDVTRVLDADSATLNRKLQRFAEDAKDADVALIYYSGHGIEAGGEDYLIPIDADISTPQTAGQKLIPLSALLDKLRAEVPITIFLLDACRTDVFPPGQMVQLPGQSTPIQVAETGLEAVRGPRPVSKPNADSKTLGMLVGFAASPGQAALDGPPGQNSPYAAALLKHLGATGFSFGDIMTLVSEEVYLKTDARQLPWTNSSLTAVLNFGSPAPTGGSDEAAILTGRRQLLMSIATEPEATRHYVESIARSESVPLDELFGMLQQLGVQTSDDPAALEAEFREGAARLKAFLAERAALHSEDPEITRLSGLADEAVDNGALNQAIAFYDQAKARVAAQSALLDAAQADLAARRLEFAQVYARSAAALELTFDFKGAAADWRAAYEQARAWDDVAALKYKRSEAFALDRAGMSGGDTDELNAAVEAYHVALDLSPRETAPDPWAETSVALGQALSDRGSRQSVTSDLVAAADTIRQALTILTRDHLPIEWAKAETALADVLFNEAYRRTDTSSGMEAADALRAALNVLSATDQPNDWAKAQRNLAAALSTIGLRGSGTEELVQSVAASRAALTVYTQDGSPLEWADTEAGLGTTLYRLGEREVATDDFTQAIVADHAALAIRTRALFPAIWARLENQLGAAQRQLALRHGDTALLTDATGSFKLSLDVTTQQSDPLLWASTQNNLANTLYDLGSRTRDPDKLRQAVAAYTLALGVQTRTAMPPDYATTNLNLGLALVALSAFGSGRANLDAAMAHYQAALTVWTRAQAPLYWATAQTNLGEAYVRLASLNNNVASMQLAIAAFDASLDERTRDRVPLDWAHTEVDLGTATEWLGEKTHSAKLIASAIADLRSAQEEASPEREPVAWALSEDQLAWALKAEGELKKSKTEIQQGRDAETLAMAAYTSAGIDRASYFAPRLAAFDAALRR